MRMGLGRLALGCADGPDEAITLVDSAWSTLPDGPWLLSLPRHVHVDEGDHDKGDDGDDAGRDFRTGIGDGNKEEETALKRGKGASVPQEAKMPEVRRIHGSPQPAHAIDAKRALSLQHSGQSGIWPPKEWHDASGSTESDSLGPTGLSSGPHLSHGHVSDECGGRTAGTLGGDLLGDRVTTTPARGANQHSCHTR